MGAPPAEAPMAPKASTRVQAAAGGRAPGPAAQKAQAPELTQPTGNLCSVQGSLEACVGGRPWAGPPRSHSIPGSSLADPALALPWAPEWRLLSGPRPSGGLRAGRGPSPLLGALSGSFLSARGRRPRARVSRAGGTVHMNRWMRDTGLSCGCGLSCWLQRGTGGWGGNQGQGMGTGPVQGLERRWLRAESALAWPGTQARGSEVNKVATD